jgi:alpha-mannosidase
MSLAGFCAGAADNYVAPDLTKDPTLYWVAYSHLDTQWRWTYPQVISNFIPNTVIANDALFQKYPHYVFNWTGANRYRMLKEYDPVTYGILSNWIAKGRWFPAGSSWEENDVNLPSSESLIRQILFGRNYFKKEFNTESDEYMLPDCFGFPASLPSILAHCGIRGFSTQKLAGWNSANGVPFSIGVWQGPDGQSIIAALDTGSYGAHVQANETTNEGLRGYLLRNGAVNGIAAAYLYYGRGDTGGAPDEQSVDFVEQSVMSTNAVRVVSARADQMFRDITDTEKARMPVYKGDLLLTEHSAGSITSEAYMKYWNHENERLANAAETAAVAANAIGAVPYPREKLHNAWGLVLGGQFHDLLPGTALPKAFEYTWNDENIAMNLFAGVIQDSVGAVARAMDTRGDGTPIVVYNPLSVAREDVVEADLDFPSTPAGISVSDGDGKSVPAQLVSSDGGKCHIVFLAKAPALGFATFTVKAGPAQQTASTLKVDDRSLENDRYRIKLDDDGDITNLFDKTANKELLFKPIRLAFLTEKPGMMAGFPTMQFPAWNMDWKDRKNPPRARVQGPAKFKIVENGPARVAIQVDREAEGSSFSQTIRLAAGSAGDRVEIANSIDWQTKASSLKVEFPLTVQNNHSTYNWDLGKIDRTVNDPKKFEVPTHQWFDLTDRSGSYGVTILTGAKYGSDMPDDPLVRLTLLYSPGVTQPFFEQRWQDWGHHDFVYGIYGHTNDWRHAGSDWQSARMDQPLLAFRTTAHDGKLGHSFSLIHLDSEQVVVRTVKLAEDSDKVIIRLQELNGTNANSVTLSAASGLANPQEVNGVETVLHPIEATAGGLKLDFTPYQMRSLAVDLTAPGNVSVAKSTPVDLPYNLNAFTPPGGASSGGFDPAGRTYASDTIGDTITSGGVTFKMGSRDAGQSNCVICRGQTISLPSGPHNRVYLLASAVDGDTSGDFRVDDHAITLGVQDWGGYIGQWDNRVFEGEVSELQQIIQNPLDHIDAGYIKRDHLAWYSSHRHNADGSNDIYRYAYLFKYRLDVTDGAKTLTLPDNPHIRIFALTAAQNDNDEVTPVHPIYDDFTGRKPITLRADANDP